MMKIGVVQPLGVAKHGQNRSCKLMTALAQLWHR